MPTTDSDKSNRADAAKTVVLATRNQGKVREFAVLLASFNLAVLGLDAFPEIGEVEETGTTFAENALLKACTVSKATGFVALADDSGIEVDALNGAPGVYSARYSATPDTPATDARNVEKLLDALRDTPPALRTTRFRCCMAACTPEGEHLLADAAWEGIVAAKPDGDNGFGYDPIFFDPDMQRTAARMTREEKNARSHRAKAVAELLAGWPKFYQAWLRGR